MKLTLGFSPCPNDTFIFDALVNKKIDTEGFDFEVHLEDVQTLNQWAINGMLDVSKISYGVLPLLLDKYMLLRSGGALGKGVGPMLISKKPVDDLNNAIQNMLIGLPGENTTAHMLFSLAFPNATQKRFLIFNQIEEAVLAGTIDAGVIIHENRFTYQEKGLVKLVDLGEYWEKETSFPIPLGGIVMKKTFGKEVQQKINKLIRKSVEVAFSNYPQLTDYIKEHAQEMNEEVMRKHIDLYVNNYSIDLGESGEQAIKKLMEVYAQIHKIEAPTTQDFIVELTD